MSENAKYQVRQDVVLTQVCGEYMLVAIKKAKEYCPSAQHINKKAALLWNKLKTGASIDDLRELIQENYRIRKGDEERVDRDIVEFLKALKEAGYLLDTES